VYFTGRPTAALKGPLGRSATGSCCSSCAEDGGSCGGHSATGDSSTTVIGLGLVGVVVWLAMKTMKKAAR
jgi:hypothetical protein